jgi:hypothetical protein
VQQQGKWLEEQIVALTTTQTDRGLVMTLGDVLFDTGEAELKNSANRVVLKIVQFLQLNPKRVVRIEGYTDSTGGKQENLKLSRDRAQSVADVLIDLGIDDKRIKVEGYGDEYPGGRERVGTGPGAEPSGGNCVFRRKRPARRRPLRVASLESPACHAAPGFFMPAESPRKTVQILLTLHCTVDYCGNCPRTLLNCSGIVSHKNKMPVKSSAAS